MVLSFDTDAVLENALGCSFGDNFSSEITALASSWVIRTPQDELHIHKSFTLVQSVTSHPRTGQKLGHSSGHETVGSKRETGNTKHIAILAFST